MNDSRVPNRRKYHTDPHRDKKDRGRVQGREQEQREDMEDQSPPTISSRGTSGTRNEKISSMESIVNSPIFKTLKFMNVLDINDFIHKNASTIGSYNLFPGGTLDLQQMKIIVTLLIQIWFNRYGSRKLLCNFDEDESGDYFITPAMKSLLISLFYSPNALGQQKFKVSDIVNMSRENMNDILDSYGFSLQNPLVEDRIDLFRILFYSRRLEDIPSYLECPYYEIDDEGNFLEVTYRFLVQNSISTKDINVPRRF